MCTAALFQLCLTEFNPCLLQVLGAAPGPLGNIHHPVSWAQGH